MRPKIILQSDFFGLHALSQGFTQFARANNGTKPTKVILNREEKRDLASLAHTGPGGSEFGDNVERGLLVFGGVSIPIESGDSFQLI